MKRFTKKVLGVTLAAALVCTSLAVAPEASAAKKAKKIIMNKKSVSLEVGQKFELKVKKTKPSKASKKVTYKVNKKGKSVIKVTKKGVIEALAEGKATVKVTSKTNKKAKAKVKVTVNKPSAVTPTTAPTGTVTAAPTGAATTTPSAATDAPKNTPKPTRTPRPTAVPTTPTPVPTPPKMEEAAAPYTLDFTDETVVLQGDATYVLNDDSSVTIGVNAQYSGVAFVVPESQKGKNYDTVTLTYKNPENIGPGYGCGLWRGSGDSEDDKGTEDVIAWSGIFAEGNEYTATIAGQDATNAWYINKALFFFNDTDTLANGPAKVTITSVVFSNSKYTGSGDDPVSTNPPSEDPVQENVQEVALADSAATAVDGNISVAYNEETGTLDGTLEWATGLVIKAPTDDIFKKVEMTYTSTGSLNGYVFDETFTDGMGQFATGQHDSTKVTAADAENTVTFDAVGDCVKAIKLVALDGATTINIKSVKFIGPAAEETPTPTETPSEDPVASPEPGEVNLVVNGDFSNGNASWGSNFGGSLVVGEDEYIAVSGRGNHFAMLTQSIEGTFLAGEEYEFSCRIRPYPTTLEDESSLIPNYVYVDMFLREPDNEDAKVFMAIDGTSEDWQEVSGTVTLTRDASAVEIRIGTRTGTGTYDNWDKFVGNFDIDDVKLIKKN